MEAGVAEGEDPAVVAEQPIALEPAAGLGHHAEPVRLESQLGLERGAADSRRPQASGDLDGEDAAPDVAQPVAGEHLDRHERAEVEGGLDGRHRHARLPVVVGVRRGGVAVVDHGREHAAGRVPAGRRRELGAGHAAIEDAHLAGGGGEIRQPATFITPGGVGTKGVVREGHVRDAVDQHAAALRARAGDRIVGEPGIDHGDAPRELRIDHQHAVRTGQHADRAALAVERVEVAGDLVRLDLDLAHIRLLRVRRCQQTEDRGQPYPDRGQPNTG